jgi:hypothetical protein
MKKPTLFTILNIASILLLIAGAGLRISHVISFNMVLLLCVSSLALQFVARMLKRKDEHI